MEMTAAANWLNSFFAGYDGLILRLMHAITCSFLTFLFQLISLIGEKGIVFFLAALVLICFSKTRKLGICLFCAVACGALFTDFIIKDLIARPRPFETVARYREYWQAIGSPAEDGYSFPSGHVTAAAAGMTTLWLMQGKKWAVPACIWILLMMVARNYLMVQYPSDVFVGVLLGIASAFIARRIANLIFKDLEDNDQRKWCRLALEYNIPDYRGIPSRLGLIEEEELIIYNGKKIMPRASARGEEKLPQTAKEFKTPAISEFRRSSAGYAGKHEKNKQ